MEVAFDYREPSAVTTGAAGDAESRLFLAPDLAREPVFLKARVTEPIVFRDALLALREVIVSKLYASPEEILRARSDPVVTVTPEAVYFEAFSRDESSYARVAVSGEGLSGLSSSTRGCTNVDFPEALERGLKAIRSSRPLWLEVGREGLAVEQPGRVDSEKRVDLPDTWMRGFLEVQSAQRLEGTSVVLGRADLRSIISYLKPRKEKESPRSLRFTLVPREVPRVEVEPWGKVFELRASKYEGRGEREIRVWGRRRLLLLERIIPHVVRARLTLLGTGSPSFLLCDLGAVSFLLGLSPWTASEWTGSARYSLFQPPASVSDDELERVASCLSKDTLGVSGLAKATRIAEAKVEAALATLCITGRVLYVAESARWVARRIFPVDPPEPPGSATREEDAAKLAKDGRVKVETESSPRGKIATGTVKGKGGTYRVACEIGGDGRLLGGTCECPFSQRASLTRGPCKHLLATRRVVAGV